MCDRSRLPSANRTADDRLRTLIAAHRLVFARRSADHRHRDVPRRQFAGADRTPCNKPKCSMSPSSSRSPSSLLDHISERGPSAESTTIESSDSVWQTRARKGGRIGELDRVDANRRCGSNLNFATILDRPPARPRACKLKQFGERCATVCRARALWVERFLRQRACARRQRRRRANDVRTKRRSRKFEHSKRVYAKLQTP